MVDYNELRRKFRPKKGPAKGKSSKAALKAIAREYELKRAELSGGAPVFSRGPLFYGLLVLLMVVIGSLVVPQLMQGGISLGRRRVERADLQARKAMNALSVALGRYRFHVGSYPTAEEGLAVLAYRKPRDIQRVRRQHPGWDGPYVNHIVQDPWGRDYYYEPRAEGGHPVLYSCGPDGRAGTTDDVLPDQLSFDAAFEDPSWTNRWAPCELRGVVVAPNEETRRAVQAEMRKYE